MTTTRQRRVFIGICLVGVVAVAGFMIIDWMVKQPLYRFGSVRSGDNLRGSLSPPPQSDGSPWQVEPDIALQFKAVGNGDPVLVVHGGPGVPYANAWKGLTPLTDRFKFYYYEQRGCGESTRPFDRFASGHFYSNMKELERTLGLGAQIADIERIRKILGKDQLTIIGHSFGGFIASMYAAEFPSHVDQLILVAPAGVLTPPDGDRDLFEQARVKLRPEQRSEYDALIAEYFRFGDIFTKSDAELAALHERVGNFLLPAMGYDASPMSERPKTGGWAVFAMYFSMGRAYDFRPALADITSPTLIIHGADDDMALPGSRSYDRAIANSQFIVIKGDLKTHAGHFIFDDCPAQFADVMEAFLADP